MATDKPSMAILWAESGTATKPEDSAIQAGWTFGATPASANENWIQQRQDQFLRHISERGIPLWDAVTSYADVAITSYNGIYYQSTAADNVNHTPGADSYWRRLSFGDLTMTTLKTSGYSANVYEYIPCDISGGSFTITLPTAPADKSEIMLLIVKSAADRVLTIQAGGTDKFDRADGPQTIYMYLAIESLRCTYQSSTGLWFLQSAAAPFNFATGFPGIDAMTPITDADITIDTTTRVLTINPARGYFDFFVDGGGKVTRYRKTGATAFPAFTDTSGRWFFYFDSSGTAVTTQTAWTSDDFPGICTVYRVLWNSSLSGAAKLVAQYIEYHQNTVPSDTHRWMHLYGSIWEKGFVMVNNALTSGAPNADGRNTVIALTTGHAVDDNMEYEVENSTGGAAWQQDMGNTTAASLNATNSALFKVFTQDSSARVSFLSATRFPFSFSAGNVPEYITSIGTRTTVSNNYFFVYFVYSTQNPVSGEAVKVISAAQEFSTITNARAYNWSDIQTTYSIIANDNEVRPLYRLIFEYKTTYDVGCKYSVLRETQDIRKTVVSTTATISGSLPASSVTVVPAGTISSANAQAAIEELDTEKVPYTGATGNVNLGTYSITSGNQFIGNDTLGASETITATNGTELFTSFTVAGNWTLGTGWEATNDGGTQLNKNAAGTGTALFLQNAPVTNNRYRVTFTMTASVTGGFTLGYGASTSVSFNPTVGVPTTYSYYTMAAATTNLTFTPLTTSRFVVTAISIKQVGADSTGYLEVHGDIGLIGRIRHPNGATTSGLYFSPNGACVFNSNITCAAVIASSTVSGRVTAQSFGLAAGDTPGFAANNTTAATAVAPIQNSPRLDWMGTAWDTSSKTHYWSSYSQVIYDSTTSTARLAFQYGYNSVAKIDMTDRMSIGSEGTLDVFGTTFAAESLTNGTLTSGTSWSRTGDMALSSNAATYTHSTGSGSLTQASGTLAVAGVANRWYKFTYTTSTVTTGATAYIDTTFASKRIYLNLVAGTYTVYFKAAASPGDFTVQVTSTAGAFTIDTLSLTQITSGNITANGKFTGGGTNGLTILGTGVSSFDSNLSVGTASFIGSERLRIAGGTAATPTATDITAGGGSLGIGTGINLIAGAQIDLTVPTVNATATGNTTSSAQAGYSSSIGDLVYLAASGKWMLADADAAATSVGLLAIALEAKTDGQAMKVALPGSFVFISAWNWTQGAVLYVSRTAGAITEVSPAGGGADGVVRVIGHAFNADCVFFNPSNDHQTVVA